MTLIAFGVAVCVREASYVRTRKTAIETIRRSGGLITLSYQAHIPFWRYWMGDEPIGALVLPRKSFSANDVAAVKHLFPESTIYRWPPPAEIKE